eukprot:gnl/MRDRNA2_/MRDRNA2_17204_c0_seq2.p1 gnl/MRDRNA2_/MRDRNA2_17204_c0~~gnl/MRDRNA2_/MRDRNA2_17204_c0_seq2.p1  ORF type:complete len:227 (+),score=36.41 gnl/MRDRNA2_/MRDRNA2_17204_c0_seq2:99-779(+)
MWFPVTVWWQFNCAPGWLYEQRVQPKGQGRAWEVACEFFHWVCIRMDEDSEQHFPYPEAGVKCIEGVTATEEKIYSSVHVSDFFKSPPWISTPPPVPIPEDEFEVKAKTYDDFEELMRQQIEEALDLYEGRYPDEEDQDAQNVTFDPRDPESHKKKGKQGSTFDPRMNRPADPNLETKHVEFALSELEVFLVFLMLALLSRKKFCVLRKSWRELRDPLMHRRAWPS